MGVKYYTEYSLTGITLPFTGNTQLLIEDNIYLDKATKRLSIGTITPGQKFVVSGGTVQIVNGSQANGYFLRSDADGVATWANISIGYITDPDFYYDTDLDRLYVNGITIKTGMTYTGTGYGSGKILTSDASGVASWQNPSGGYCISITCQPNGFTLSGGTSTGMTLAVSGGNIDLRGRYKGTTATLILDGEILLRGSDSGNKLSFGSGTAVLDYKFTVSGISEKLLDVECNGNKYLTVEGNSSPNQVVVNEDAKTCDFRAEGVNNPLLLRTDSANDRVVIGGNNVLSAILGKLEIDSTLAGDGGSPALYLKKTDGRDPFIIFSGVTTNSYNANPSANLSTFNGGAGAVSGPKQSSGSGGWVFVGMVRISIPGAPTGDLWMPVYQTQA